MVETSIESQRARAKDVDYRKKTIELRLAEILTELDSMPGSPGLYDSLVDPEVHIFCLCQKEISAKQKLRDTCCAGLPPV